MGKHFYCALIVALRAVVRVGSDNFLFSFRSWPAERKHRHVHASAVRRPRRHAAHFGSIGCRRLIRGGHHTFDNEAPAAGTATVVIGSAIDVDGPLPLVGARLIANVDPINSNTGPVAADSEGGPPDFVGGDSISVAGTGATDADFDTTILATEMLPYMGTGMVTFNYDTLTNTTGSTSTTGGGANRVEFAAIRSNFTATITYEFVPEPATWVMLLMAVAVLAAIASRSRLLE